jgi:hypothetical protein
MRIDGLSLHREWASLPKLRAGRDDFALKLEAAMPLAIAAAAVICGLKGTLAQGHLIAIASQTQSLNHFQQRRPRGARHLQCIVWQHVISTGTRAVGSRCVGDEFVLAQPG